MTDTIHDDPLAPDPDGDVEDWDDDGEYVYIPKEMGLLRKGFIVFVSFGVIVFGILGVCGWWLMSQVREGERTGPDITVTVTPGATMAQVSRLLEEKGVVKNATVFRYYSKFKGLDAVKAGDYDKFQQGMSLDQVVERLKKDPLPQRFAEVNFPEGYTVSAVHNKILNTFPDMNDAELGFAEMAAANSQGLFHQPGQPLEGFLFPATYRVQKGELVDEKALLDQMMKKFDEVGATAGLDKSVDKLRGVAGKQDIMPYDALIVASIIEKEAKVPEDRAKVARVIYNRLLRNMRLEIDATIFYCPGFGDKNGKLTQSDLNSDCAYNTRKKSGLPPTPISNPGKAAIEAALNPAEGDWLYYVLADKNGAHFFTNNYNEFLKVKKQSEDAGII